MFSVTGQHLILLTLPLSLEWIIRTHGLEPEVVCRVVVLSICALYRFIGNERGAS